MNSAVNTISQVSQWLENSQIPNYIIFVLFVLLSIAIGRYTPRIISIIVHRFAPRQRQIIYDNFIAPIQQPFKKAGTLLLISSSLVWLEDYPWLYNFLKFFIHLGVTISLAWLASRLFRQVVQIYGINLIRKSGLEVDEMLLVFQTIANVAIGLIAALAFARGQGIPLTGLLASFGIGGLAISFAASKTLEQLLGTVVLYLDRPFVPGEYIRLPDKLYGRVESIGLRSTKIRAAAKGTLFIIPNSILANLQIENITRGKKVMVLLYLDFTKKLEERDHALVQQVVKESTNSLFGIDPGSTNIALIDNSSNQNTKARVTFFILGSNENSIQLRKRLLESANEKMSQKLKGFGIEFIMQEPNIYVESPVTL
ncbi:MAG: mechanosensitive ion channel family protein [Hormoscilla sp.]